MMHVQLMLMIAAKANVNYKHKASHLSWARGT